ncbi:MAG: glutamine-hydrolyzing carbamoyl-phosphate synthase small subunit [Deltaproteobacteria bacterium]|jgi:carbamoyl-phosphate synthase small subunit|nr:glutamine-hydrolyzing carbamoyl-phosphate synthase small subunit [Deltaproteobacteria bacterium]
MTGSKKEKAILMFEDGIYYEGFYEGKIIESGGEGIFNTAMNGYQELITDPSYNGQVVVMTYPMVGNYGINDTDFESEKVWISGLVTKNYVQHFSHYAASKNLAEFINSYGYPVISGIDTRHITIILRDGGQSNVYIAPKEAGIGYIKNRLDALPKMEGLNLVSNVSTKSVYEKNIDSPDFRVTVIDYGVKFNTLRCLSAIKADITVVPHNFSKKEILATEPDGILLSNGPGDPKTMSEEVETLKSLLGEKPVLGICLGHQLLSLALGFDTYKLKFGHHGINQPVKNLKTGKVEITSQNHGFCVNLLNGSANYSNDTKLTHINLNDNTVEGIKNDRLKAFSVQYHPESSPGPRDSRYLFSEFKELCLSSKIEL